MKGCEGLNEAEKQRNEQIEASAGDSVHKERRKNYTNPKIIKRDLREGESDDLCITSSGRRSLGSQFSFAKNCLFCGRPAKFDSKKEGYDVYPVRTFGFQEKISEICEKRGDDWADKVTGRLECCHDLHASDAVYHQQCNVNFRTNMGIPKTFLCDDQLSAKKKRGRPTDTDKEEAFLRVALYLEENDNEQITVGESVLKMKEYCGEDSYTPKYMKKRITEHFGNKVIISEINGKPNVVTLRSNAASILHEFYDRPKQQDADAERRRNIETAANLIKNDIKMVETSKINYPLVNDISSIDKNVDFIPISLRIFLRKLFLEKNSDTKIASIGQAIIQATRLHRPHWSSYYSGHTSGSTNASSFWIKVSY